MPVPLAPIAASQRAVRYVLDPLVVPPYVEAAEHALHFLFVLHVCEVCVGFSAQGFCPRAFVDVAATLAGALAWTGASISVRERAGVV